MPMILLLNRIHINTVMACTKIFKEMHPFCAHTGLLFYHVHFMPNYYSICIPAYEGLLRKRQGRSLQYIDIAMYAFTYRLHYATCIHQTAVIIFQLLEAFQPCSILQVMLALLPT